ncbi:hypothetical protein AcW2_006194 [Taiwanofungus camphoratus]|nr:hypothetical protein AcW2_006194 [Antrodia cinnamomea]
MPPKRKADSAVSTGVPPVTRRRRKLQVEAEAITTRAATLKSSKRGRPLGSAAIARSKGTDAIPHNSRLSDLQSSSRALRPHQGRRNNPNREPLVPSRVAGSSSSPTKLHDATPTLSREGIVYETGEADELLLTPSKKQPSRPVTPPRMSTTPRVTTPRTFMRCVEIVTPSKRFLRTPSRDIVSPVPSPYRRHLQNVDVENAPLRASTPPLTTHKRSPQSVSFKRKLSQVVRDPPKRSTRQFFEHDSGSGPISPPATPTKPPPLLGTPSITPSNRKTDTTPHASPSCFQRNLPAHLHSSLHAQKRAILKWLQNMPDIEGSDDIDIEDAGCSANAVAYEQLCYLLKGTVVRGEGNSCLLMGPRGSGKTRLVEQAIASQPDKPIVIHLSGHVQQNDRLAIREIARQLRHQTGSSFLPSEADKSGDTALTDPENPFLDMTESTAAISLPAPAHLLALISMIPTLPRPTVIVLDAFDLFATHARQSLLYCLLDTVQSCRVGKINKGIAVIGVTTRIDTINLLEKRVKSRFSGRMLRMACPRRLQCWSTLARDVLSPQIEADGHEEWPVFWATAVDNFLREESVVRVFNETFALARDVQTLRRILTPVVLELTPWSPSLSSFTLAACAGTQRCPPTFPSLSALPYPAICLLISAMHAQTSGHDIFTFEMLYESFKNQVRTSQSAPVQIEGGSIGMVKCSREVLIGALERLVSLRAFVAVSVPSVIVAREFTPYRCAVDRAEVKKAVETMGQTSLKKWLNKMQ